MPTELIEQIKEELELIACKISSIYDDIEKELEVTDGNIHN